MWICTNKGFLSIVDDGKVEDCLVVRARRKGDIEAAFPGAEVKTLKGRDYQFRAHIKRNVVAEAVAKQINEISYDNFKNSVDDHDLHNAYSSFWSIHARLQPKPQYTM